MRESILVPDRKLLDTFVTFNNGKTMPIFACGMYNITESQAVEAVLDGALELGYRCFDTASIYDNERTIGAILPKLLEKHDLIRKDIFIASKLAPHLHGLEMTHTGIEESLENLNLNYLDLYLINWPATTARGISRGSRKHAVLRSETWSVLEDFYNDGRLKSIGVSNFNLRHLKQLMESCQTMPAVNQVEFNIYYRYPDDFMSFHVENGIVLQACSIFGGQYTLRNWYTVNDPTVRKIAERLKVTTGQLLLKWTMQEGFAIVAKTLGKERLLENSQANFFIPDEEMETIRNIPTQPKFSWRCDRIA